MEIIFVRHAEKEELGENPPLTKKGKKQAEYLAKTLLKLKTFDNFYCSDLDRTKQTAKIVSKKIKTKPRIEKSLNEVKSETLKKNRNKWSNEEKKHYKNLVFFLKRITKNPDEKKKILIIAHGITNRIILSFFLKLNMKRLLQFKTRETAINSIYWVDKYKNWRLKYWGNNFHLPKKLRKKED
jgi:broad specificity phosphatase PhoE